MDWFLYDRGLRHERVNFGEYKKSIGLKWVNVRETPTGIYLLKVNNRNSRLSYEICSKLTMKTPERHHWGRSGIFIVNFEHISDVALVFLLLTLRR